MKLAVFFAVCFLAHANAFNYQRNSRVQPLSYGGYSQQQTVPQVIQPIQFTPKPIQQQQQFTSYQQVQPQPTFAPLPQPTFAPQVIQPQVQSEYSQQEVPMPPPAVTQPSYQQYQTAPPPPPPAVIQPTYQSYQTVPPPAVTQPSYQQYQQPAAPIVPVAPAAPQPSYGSSYGQQQGGIQSVQQPTFNPCLNAPVDSKVADSQFDNQFYACSDGGHFHLMQCPQGLKFRQETQNCENTLRASIGCAVNPCMNGGSCTDLPFGKTLCNCLPGFNGDFCEKSNGCASNTCGSNGICVPLPDSAPVSKYCICNGGNSVGLDCTSSVEQNPCLSNDADLATYPSQFSSALYIQCDGQIPHLRFCNYPLVYSHQFQGCDWTATSAPIVDQTPIPVPAPLPVPQRPQIQQPQQQYQQFQAPVQQKFQAPVQQTLFKPMQTFKPVQQPLALPASSSY